MSPLDTPINDRYRLIRKLGEGGMGEVYLAEDLTMQRQVAIKFIRGALGDPDSYTRLLQHFQQEARTLAKLSHPNIVHVYDFGDFDGRPYLVMEYLPGGSLAERMGAPLPWQEACKLAATVAKALAFAHSEGVLHRDIKPSNILFTKSGEPMVSDFGLAHLMDPGGEGDSSYSVSLIGGAQPVGTPAYMAPEQWSGKATEQSDIYSLGVVLFQMLTGQVPYPGKTPGEVVTSTMMNPLPQPRALNVNIPKKLEIIVQRALARDPGKRFSSMEEFTRVLFRLDKESPAAESSRQFSFKLPVNKVPLEKPKESTLESEKLVQITESETPAISKRKLVFFIIAGIAVLAFLIIGVTKHWFVSPAATQSPPIIVSTTVPTQLTTNTTAPTETAQPPTPTSLPPTPTSTPGIGSTMQGVDGMTLVYVPGGTFLMGSPDGVGDSNEHPQHQVTLDGFWIDLTEVTNEKFAVFLNRNDKGNFTEGGATWLDAGDSDARIYNSGGEWQVKSGYEDHPVTEVTWYGANAYCLWADRQLPTEAQWEYAARGSDGSTYPWGNDSRSCDLANYSGCNGDTQPVGSHTAGKSWVGAFDLAGNVWEWVRDVCANYSSDSVTNPVILSGGVAKVLRGGSWFDYEFDIRSANRSSNFPTYSYVSNGFRCLLPLQ